MDKGVSLPYHSGHIECAARRANTRARRPVLLSPLETRERILVELRGTGHTVRELAEELGVTSNAVRDHIEVLQERGLVEATGLQRGTGGKPARIYELTAGGEDSFGQAYLSVLRAILDSLARSAEEEDVRRILDDAGRRLGRQFARSGDGFGERVRKAASVLDEMGGMAEVNVSDGTATISGSGCPLSAVVRDHPEACRLARALLGEITGARVREECERGARPGCRFWITRTVETADG